MKIRRFVAKDMRTALVQIKEELGADAVIMSNKKIAEGVELMAAIDYGHVAPQRSSNASEKEAVASRATATAPVNGDRSIAQDVVSFSHTPPVSALSHGAEQKRKSAPADSLSALLNRQVQQNAQKTQATTHLQSTQASMSAENNIKEQLRSFTDRLQQTQDETTLPLANQDFTSVDNDFQSQNSGNRNFVSQQDFTTMQHEMAAIRQLLEHQVSGLMWQDMAQKDPMRAMLVDKLSALGLTEHMADQITGYIPKQIDEAQAWQYALNLLTQQINTTNNDIIQRGGVVALVGPTGVGKTTTIAKLAARFAQINGADSVALISTDTFRIAGFEQLETYGRIIGCQVKLAKDASTLDSLLQQCSKKKLVLIDTAGMGQRDLRLAEHLTTLMSNSRVRIRNYLVLAANTQQGVMQENVERFKKVPLAGCIYTKLDESVSIGEIISTSIQNGLPIGYLTDGQRVPEDIKVANAEKLVMLAQKMTQQSSINNTLYKRSIPEYAAVVV